MNFIMHCAVCLGTKDLKMVSTRKGDRIVGAIFVCSDHSDGVVINLTAKSANGQKAVSMAEIFGMSVG